MSDGFFHHVQRGNKITVPTVFLLLDIRRRLPRSKVTAGENRAYVATCKLANIGPQSARRRHQKLQRRANIAMPKNLIYHVQLAKVKLRELEAGFTKKNVFPSRGGFRGKAFGAPAPFAQILAHAQYCPSQTGNAGLLHVFFPLRDILASPPFGKSLPSIVVPAHANFATRTWEFH